MCHKSLSAFNPLKMGRVGMSIHFVLRGKRISLINYYQSQQSILDKKNPKQA